MRGAALFGALALPAAIIFAPHGLRAEDLVRSMHQSLATRGALWTLWIVLATPASSAAFMAPGTRTLRSLRISAGSTIAALVFMLLFLQTPWMLLFAYGENVASAVARGLTAVALETSAFSARRSRRGALIFSASALLVIFDSRASLALGPAALLAFASTHLAWRVALEETSAHRIVVRAPPVVALASAELARAIRSAPARLHAATLIMLAGGAALGLSLRNDLPERPLSRALTVLATPIAIACALIAAPALETELRLRGILRSIRIRSLTLTAAMALAIATPTSALAATAGAIARSTSQSQSSSLVLVCAAWSLPVAVCVAAWARRSATARRSSTFVIGVAVIAAVFTAIGATC